jgi:hypothetical protein
MNIVVSQNTSFFNDYHKLSFQFGLSKYSGNETSPLPNTLSYRFNNYTSPHFGFYYDALQTDNFNFKVGLSAVLVREIDEFFIDASQIPNEENASRDFGEILESEGTWRFNLPITAEYFVPTNSSNLIVNGSLILGYSEEFGNTENEYAVRVQESEDFTKLNSIYSRNTAPWYFNAQFGIGMYFPFEKWMLRANIYYNFALQNIYDGTFTFSNLAQSPDTSGDISFRGDSFGMEFSVYLKKKKKD